MRFGLYEGRNRVAALAFWSRGVLLDWLLESSIQAKPMWSNDSQSQPSKRSDSSDLALKAITYSLDCLIPGFYLWLGPIKLRLGGSLPEKDYPGVIHSKVGIAIVLPGYRIFSTYQGTYDPR
jgi:hypothetical protein